MKELILLVAVWMTVSSGAVQTPASPWAEPYGAFFALSVPDAEASAAWYQKHLGFQIISKGEAPNKVARGILLQGNGSLIEIVQHSKAQPLKVLLPHAEGAHEVHGIFKSGLHVRDIDSAYRAVRKSGAEIAYNLDGTSPQTGMRSFTLRDNNGNLVQFLGK
jgi:catechol 2,3-dioxygenase-like lactoylglutathione lyase family enzyme